MLIELVYLRENRLQAFNMKLSLDLKATLSQTLTPQQIQYLKLLQLPLVQLEQQVRQEIEANPMLEEVNDLIYDDIDDIIPETPRDDFGTEPLPSYESSDYTDSYEDSYNESYDDNFSEYNPALVEKEKARIDDDVDPFDFYKAVWQDDSEFPNRKGAAYDDEDFEPFQIKDNTTFAEDLLQQLRMHYLTDEELLIGAQIIGNIDEDGYLRRELVDIVDETNSFIAEYNFNIQKEEYEKANNLPSGYYKENPARMYSLSKDAASALVKVQETHPDIASNLPGIALFKKNLNGESKKSEKKILSHVNISQAEKILALIQTLDPPGIGSRTVQECLIAQCRGFINPSPAQYLALDILENSYDAFTKKHYHILTKQYGISEQELKDAFEVIRRLNPKPGGSDFQAEVNTVIPDFVVEHDEDSDDLIITVNDTNMPQLKLSKAYDRLKRDARKNQYNKETREWIRNKYEDAKFLIQAIRQRKSTMLKVMTAIANFQRAFFDEGKSGVKPLIYKDVAEATGLDISTVCRIVNGKYVQTEFGTYELKFFFSESLPTDDGEDVSTTVIKDIIKKMIDTEPKDKPHSDDKISKDLKDQGYNVARRTVAKYREQMRIPVARLRKEI